MPPLLNTLRKVIRESDAYAPIRRWRLENLTRQDGAYPDWSRLLEGHDWEWRNARAAASGPRVGVMTSLGLHFTANTIDSLIAVALTLRGAQVEFVYCDGVLPACQVIEHTVSPSIDRIARKGPSGDFCAPCFGGAQRMVAPLGLPCRLLSDFLEDGDQNLAWTFADANANRRDVGAQDANVAQAYAGALRFFGKADLGDDPQSTAIFRRYLAAAWLAASAARRLISDRRYDIVLAHHGIYVPQGQIADAARETGVRLTTWHPAYRRGRLIYQHGDTYHRAMIDEPASRWAHHALTSAQNQALDRYLTSRETGSQDWITFQRQAPESPSELWKTLDLDPQKQTILLAANVVWDARLHYAQSAYGHMIDWAVDTVRWFSSHPEKQLIVRCHPGEVMNSPRAQDRLDDALRSAFPAMPANIRIIAPEDKTNTYALSRLSCAALIFNTKMGMELAARGVPVVVAGDAWIRGKGFSRDATDKASYLALLDDPATYAPLTESERDRARRYIYHFYFRRCIPVRALDVEAGWPLTSLRDDAYALCQPGADQNLDMICNGLLHGSPFETVADDDDDKRVRS